MRIAVKRPLLKLPGVPFIPMAEWADSHSAVSWIAFGTALPAVMWDSAIYPGARRWDHPNKFMLAFEARWTGDRRRAPLPANVAHMLSLDGVAEGPSTTGGMRASDAAARQAAEQAHQRLRRLETRSRGGEPGPAIKAMHAAIRDAAAALRDGCLLGKVRVKGRPNLTGASEGATASRQASDRTSGGSGRGPGAVRPRQRSRTKPLMRDEVGKRADGRRRTTGCPSPGR